MPPNKPDDIRAKDKLLAFGRDPFRDLDPGSTCSTEALEHSTKRFAEVAREVNPQVARRLKQHFFEKFPEATRYFDWMKSRTIKAKSE